MTASCAPRRRKILFVGHGSGLGGAERSYLESAKALRAEGMEIHGLLPEPGPVCERLAAMGIAYDVYPFRWWIVPFGRIRRGRRRRRGQRALIREQLGAVRFARALIRRIEPDIVVSHSIATPPFAAIAARLCGRPHVWSIREFGREDHRLHFLFGDRLSGWIVNRLSDRVLANSDAVREKFSRWIERRKIEVLDGAVECDGEILPDPEPAAEVPRDRLRIALLGTMIPGKGQAEAIRAVELLVERGLDPELSLVGGGEPEYKRELGDLIRRLGLADRVEISDFTSQPMRVLAGADLVVVTSRSEAFGRVTVEAMKLGKAVIGAAAGATPEIIRPEFNGLLYESGNPRDLADKIAFLHGNRAELSRLGENARSWAIERFNSARHGRNYARILETVLS